MQLLLGLRDAWKCIEVRLKDGCTPCIGGKAVSDCNIEPAQWFKVSKPWLVGFALQIEVTIALIDHMYSKDRRRQS